MHFTQHPRFFWIAIFAVLLLGARQVISASLGQEPGALMVNEVVASNRTGLLDEDGDYSDWIELYNQSDRAISLAGWSLTDDPNQPEKWPFPDRTLDRHGYLLVFASGKTRQPTQPGSELHANFKLSQEGEFLGLYNILDGHFGHRLTSPGEQKFPQQFNDISYGRYVHPPGGSGDKLTFGYLTTPTPGQPNDEAVLWLGLVEPVKFNYERGFYQAPFSLELTSSTPNATIIYTTDGREPGELHGTTYSGPIDITSTTLVRATAVRANFRPAPLETHSYIFLDEVRVQPPNPPGFPDTWGGYEGVAVKADYEMDPEIVNDPYYSEVIEDALLSIPSISIVTDRQSFHNLYTSPQRRGKAWERPVSVELIDPEGDQAGFHIRAGLRIQGELGRSEFMPKHGLRLFFREEYGAGRLEYPLFPDSSVEEFDTLVLRSGVNRSYAGYPKRQDEIRQTTYTRDEWLRASQLALSGSGSHGIFVHLYLNGLYWGLYNVIERPDAAFMGSYFEGAEDDWQTISHEETVSTTNERFKTLHQLAKEGGLEDAARYNIIKSHLDIPHFIDYLILNWYAGNLDWGFNNWYAGAQHSSGQVRYFVWDGERTWFEGAEIFMDLDEYLERPNLVKPLLEALMDNPDFRIALADRMYRHLANDGALTEANAQARWLNINRTIEQAIIAESARWGDTRFESPLTHTDWLRARDDVLAQMDGNAAGLMTLAREAGYYPALDPPILNQQGRRAAAGFEVAMKLPASSAGLIFFTTDGTDPRQPVTGTVAPAANIYRRPLILTGTVRIKARVFEKGSWSALNEAIFSLEGEASGRLQITEIMYNPLGGDDFEFVELKNTGQADLNLVDMSFDGIDFTFPPAFLLQPGDSTVLVRNPEAFARRYPGVDIGGAYKGRLSNSGEELVVNSPTGKPLVSLNYDDDNGWPISPDGRGDSLVLVAPGLALNDPGSWRASTTPHGSPGSDDPGDYTHPQD